MVSGFHPAGDNLDGENLSDQTEEQVLASESVARSTKPVSSPPSDSSGARRGGRRGNTSASGPSSCPSSRRSSWHNVKGLFAKAETKAPAALAAAVGSAAEAAPGLTALEAAPRADGPPAVEPSPGSESASVTQQGYVATTDMQQHHVAGRFCPPHGAKAICGRRARMEDAYTAVPFLLEVPPVASLVMAPRDHDAPHASVLASKLSRVHCVQDFQSAGRTCRWCISVTPKPAASLLLLAVALRRRDPAMSCICVPTSAVGSSIPWRHGLPPSSIQRVPLRSKGQCRQPETAIAGAHAWWRVESGGAAAAAHRNPRQVRQQRLVAGRAQRQRQRRNARS